MRTFFIASILAGLFIGGCSKNENEDAIYRKNIMGGYAYTLNELMDLDSVNHVKVDLISGDKILSTISNDSGYWEIPDVPTGTYSIRVSRDGYIGAETVGQQFLMWYKTHVGYQAVYKKFEHPLDYFHVSSDNDNIRIDFSFDEQGWKAKMLYQYDSKIEVKVIGADTTFNYYSSIQKPDYLGQTFILSAADTVYTRFSRSILKDRNAPGTNVEVSLRVGGRSLDLYYAEQFKNLDRIPTLSDVLDSETITLQ